MNIHTIKNDISVFYVEADKFPDGIQAAHKKLDEFIGSFEGRNFYGISFGGPGGNIIYRAASAEIYPGEAEKLGCNRTVIAKGDYLCETLHNWKEDTSVISKTFNTMLKDERMDKNGCCVEVLINEKEMLCLVKMK